MDGVSPFIWIIHRSGTSLDIYRDFFDDSISGGQVGEVFMDIAVGPVRGWSGRSEPSQLTAFPLSFRQ